MTRIAVIGAGMAGLSLASALRDHAEIMLFEKSRGYGGRMATRYSDGYQFDHGAQFFIARTREFKSFVQTLLDEHIIAPWEAHFVELTQNKITYEWIWTNEVPHYVAVPGMNALGKYMAKPLNVTLQTRVKRIEKNGQAWRLFDEDSHSLGKYDWVISSAPAKQGTELLPTEFRYHNELRSKRMIGCYSLMLGFSQPLAIDWDAALVKDMDISWICNNSNKPGRPDNYALLAHATNKWAEANMDMPDRDVQRYLIEQLEQITECSMAAAEHRSIHRWRYANIRKQDGAQSYVDMDNRLAAIGDWCIKGRIESAFQSGHHAAQQIRGLL